MRENGMSWSGRKVTLTGYGKGFHMEEGKRGALSPWVNTESGNAVFMCVLGLQCSRGFRQNGNTGEKQ